MLHAFPHSNDCKLYVCDEATGKCSKEADKWVSEQPAAGLICTKLCHPHNANVHQLGAYSDWGVVEVEVQPLLPWQSQHQDGNATAGKPPLHAGKEHLLAGTCTY